MTPVGTTARAVRAGLPDESRGRKGHATRQQGYTWILPALVISVGTLYYCIGYTGYISTLDWNGVSTRRRSVGFGNYADMLSDDVFWRAIGHTAVFFLVTFCLSNLLGLVLASLLHSRIRLKALFKVVVFTPVLLAPAIMAPVFRQMFGADGTLNEVLRAVGLGSLAHEWIADSATALPVIMAIAIWHSTGLSFILYFAALSQIETEILEAARLDGAGNLRVFFSVVLPSVKGTVSALAILGAIGALKVFDIPYLVTAAGPNHATEFLGTLIYRQSIPLAHVGYGAALSIALLILALAMGLVLNAVRERS